MTDSTVQDNEGFEMDVSSSPESLVSCQPDSQSRYTELIPGPVHPSHNLLEDPLLQLSPRVVIPRKKVPVYQSKQGRQMDVVPHEGIDVSKQNDLTALNFVVVPEINFLRINLFSVCSICYYMYVYYTNYMLKVYRYICG